MSVVKSPPTPGTLAEPAAENGWRPRARTLRPAASVVARGEPTLWLTAGALAVAVAMIVGLITLVVVMGGRAFWPDRLVQLTLVDGRVLLGEITGRESFQLSRDQLDRLPEAQRARAAALMGADDKITLQRVRLRIDNKQINGETYVWINDIARVPDRLTHPEWAMTLERTSWGRFLGMPRAFIIEQPRPISGTEEQLTGLIEFLKENAPALDAESQSALMSAIEQLEDDRAKIRARSTAVFLDSFRDGTPGIKRVAISPSGKEIPLDQAAAEGSITAVREIYAGPAASWNAFQEHHPKVRQRSEQIHEIERGGLGRLSREIEAARMATVRAGLEINTQLEPLARRLAEQDAARAGLAQRMESRQQMLAAIARRSGQDSELTRAFEELVTELNTQTQSQIREIKRKIAEIEKNVPAAGREAVTNYREIAGDIRGRTAGLTSQLIELEDRNDAFTWRLATADGTLRTIPVAEIVRAFPANQLSFWGRLRIYVDRWIEFVSAEPREANMEGGVFPAIWGTIAMTLIMTIAVVPFGVLAALYLREYAKAGPIVSAVRIAVNNLAGVPSIVFGVFGLGFFCYVVGAQIDQVFYPEYVAQNKPVFETGGLLWASLTLALLTLPVVIVATEEALASVPNSMREGSYACGASKWQTIRRIVLPRAMPGIMTGMILAMARGAGEVAPLMLVGAVKIAPALPVDLSFPYLHPSRSFMHLGFHIYDLGFQSPDSEAAKPMVFTTTLLLITIIGVLNIAAIIIRNRLRRRFATSQF